MGRRRQLYYERNGRRHYADSPWSVIRRKEGEAQTVNYRTTLLYQPWMDTARLAVTEDLCGCGEVQPGNQLTLQQADIAFRPRLAYIAPEVEVEKRRALSGEAYLDFVRAYTPPSIPSCTTATSASPASPCVDMPRPKEPTAATPVWPKAAPGR